MGGGGGGVGGWAGVGVGGVGRMVRVGGWVRWVRLAHGGQGRAHALQSFFVASSCFYICFDIFAN